MGMIKTDYIILGFDLTQYWERCYTDKWRTDENIEKWEHNQTKGNIRLFTDSSSAYLYFGYILYTKDKYDDEPIKINLSGDVDIEEYINKRYYEVIQALRDSKLFYKLSDKITGHDKIPFQIISFSMYR